MEQSDWIMLAIGAIIFSIIGYIDSKRTKIK